MGEGNILGDVYPGGRLLRSLTPGYCLSPRWGFGQDSAVGFLCAAATGVIAAHPYNGLEINAQNFIHSKPGNR